MSHTWRWNRLASLGDFSIPISLNWNLRFYWIAVRLRLILHYSFCTIQILKKMTLQSEDKVHLVKFYFQSGELITLTIRKCCIDKRDQTRRTRKHLTPINGLCTIFCFQRRQLREFAASNKCIKTRHHR